MSNSNRNIDTSTNKNVFGDKNLIEEGTNYGKFFLERGNPRLHQSHLDWKQNVKQNVKLICNKKKAKEKNFAILASRVVTRSTSIGIWKKFQSTQTY